MKKYDWADFHNEFLMNSKKIWKYFSQIFLGLFRHDEKCAA